MAVSAFKSTSRRRSIGPATDGSSSSFQLSGKRSHRRSNSFTDFTQSKYLGDSPKQRDNRIAHHKTRSMCFLNRQLSGSDMGKRSSVEEPEDRRETSASYLSSPDWEALQRQADELHSLGSSKKLRRKQEKYLVDVAEGQAEEKIIRAVHAQNKPTRSNSLSREHVMELFNTIREDVWLAVNDMKNVFYGQSQERTLPMESLSPEFGDKSAASFADDVIKAFRYVCKNYATKIEQTEEEVRMLRARLAAQERQCLDLTNLINRLIPGPDNLQKPQDAQQEKGEPAGEILDEDTILFTDKCVSLSSPSSTNLNDCALKTQLSCERRANYWLEPTCQEICSVLEIGAHEQRERFLSSCPSSSTAINKDGLVLPWLQSEEGIIECSSSSEKIEERQECVLLNPVNLPEIRRISERHMVQFNRSGLRNAANNTRSIKARKNSCRTNSRTSEETTNVRKRPSQLSNASSMHMRSEEMISERIELRSRIESGELLLCIGTFQIF